MVRVKVCGLTSVDQAVAVSEMGADALGFIREPKSPRFMDEYDVIERIRESVDGVDLVAVYAQMWGDEWEGRFDVLQGIGLDRREGKVCLRAVRAEEGEGVPELLEKAGGMELVLLDAFHPTLGGGTGETMDWGLAAEFVAAYPGSVALAGGLGADNVAEAVRRVRPAMVDASSRLEVRPGVKDLELVRRYIEEAKGA